MGTQTNSDAVTVASGLSFSTCLALMFICLKLLGVIHWSWALVTLPLWGPVVLVLLGTLLAIGVMAIIAAVSK